MNVQLFRALSRRFGARPGRRVLSLCDGKTRTVVGILSPWLQGPSKPRLIVSQVPCSATTCRCSHLDEGSFSRTLRGYLRLAGLEVVCVFEADNTGTSDLIISSQETTLILAWAELKTDDEPLRPSQVEFLRHIDKKTGNAYVLRHHGGTGLVTVERPRAVDGWSVDRKMLEVIHTTGLWASGFDWTTAFTQWRRTRGRASRKKEI